jgi:MarR family transcriptional regulator, organic hydroperoxide resistance regulator
LSPEEELRFLILGAQREGNRIFGNLLAPLGLTPSQAEVLRVLAEGEPLSLNAVGGRLVCETGSPSRLVDALVKAGLVARIENPADRREVTLSLSPEGRRKSEEAASVEAVLHDWIGGRMPPRQLDAAVQALRVLVQDTVAGKALGERRVASRTAHQVELGDGTPIVVSNRKGRSRRRPEDPV